LEGCRGLEIDLVEAIRHQAPVWWSEASGETAHHAVEDGRAVEIDGEFWEVDDEGR